MTTNYYELLELDSTAPADEIKKAFRREIARYHPDKVQHLGKEFQAIAAAKAAELTEAYRILMDPALRATYDEQVASGDVGSAPPAGPRASAYSAAPPPAAGFTDRPGTARPADTPAPDPAEAPPSTVYRQERATRDDFVRRAAVAKFREAVASAPEAVDNVSAPGFDLGYVIRPKRGMFKKADPPVRVLTRFVPTVDAAAVQESWVLARKARVPQNEVPCVVLVGTGLAAAGELAGAIAEQRRHDRGAAPLVLVPIDVRTWEALMPTDAPQAVRGIIERLRSSR